MSVKHLMISDVNHTCDVKAKECWICTCWKSVYLLHSDTKVLQSFGRQQRTGDDHTYATICCDNGS